MRILRLCIPFVLISTLCAWNAAGHKTVAFIAYRNLNARARANVDRLLQSHPDYSRWVEGVPEKDRALEAFLHSSIWADEIKGDPRYQNQPPDAKPPEHPEYPDMFRHQNWHYIDTPLIGEFDALHIDESNTTWRNPPTAISQIRVMETILRDRKGSDAAKAWAIGWLVHLIGDLQQPLHCVARYSNDASGKLVDDQGGNRVALQGKQHNLHSLWDGAAGEDSSSASVSALGTDLMSVWTLKSLCYKRRPDPRVWVNEGAQLSIAFVYRGLAGAPSNEGAIDVSASYRRVAEAMGGEQVALGGYRLADELNRLLSK